MKERNRYVYENGVVINDVEIVSLTPVLAFLFLMFYSFFLLSERIGKKVTFLKGGIFQIRCTGKMAFSLFFFISFLSFFLNL